MAVQCKTIGITNEDVCKHFRRPFVPFAMPKMRIADVARYWKYKAPNEVSRGQCCTASPKLESHKNVQTQTDYRESEAQTDPWEPPYKVVPGDNCIAPIINKNLKKKLKTFNEVRKKNLQKSPQRSQSRNTDTDSPNLGSRTTRGCS